MKLKIILITGMDVINRPGNCGYPDPSAPTGSHIKHHTAAIIDEHKALNN